MKYIIEIEDEPLTKSDCVLWKCKNFNSLVFDKVGLSKLTPYVEPEDEIIIGDEVLYYYGNKEWKYVVTNINKRHDIDGQLTYTVYTGITSDGEWVSSDIVKKTGRHFDKAVELLKEMKD